MKKRMKKLLTLFVATAVLCSWAVSPVSLAQPSALAAQTAITSLAVNFQDTPIGLERDNVRFSWKMESNLIGQAQVGYRIDLRKGAADGAAVWNSGFVDSDQSTGIVYDGPELALETRYYWTVSVLDAFGATYANTAYFETGCDWTGAEWIVNPDQPAIPTTGNLLSDPLPTPYFRVQKNLPKTVSAATLYITALGTYDAYINGKEVKIVKPDGTVEDDIFNPGWTDYYYYLNYQGYDVASYIKGNEDIALAVQLSRGWHAGGISTRTQSPTKVSQDMALLAKLVITYADGTREVIKTNTTDWKTSNKGPIVDNDFFNGVNYDARLNSLLYNVNGTDWNNVNFPTDTWKAPRTLVGRDTPQWNKHADGYAGQLIASAEATAVVLDKKIYPVSGYTYKLSEIKHGTYSNTATGGVWTGSQDSDLHFGEVVEHAVNLAQPITLQAGERLLLDLGQNIAGWNTLKISGAEGTKIDILQAERLNDGKKGPTTSTSLGSCGPKGTLYWVGLTNGGQFTSAILKPTLTSDPWGPLFVSGSGRNAQDGKYPFSDRLILGAGATAANPYTFRPQWTYHGYQYVEIRADANITIHDIYAEVVTSAIDQAGDIETDNAAVNQLFSNNVWSNIGNFISVPIDCPNRAERMGWTGDINIYAKTAMYNFDSAAFLNNYVNVLDELAAATFVQNGNYTPGGYAPTTPGGSGLGMGYNSPWSDALITAPYAIYRSTGDTSIIKTYYEGMTKYMQGFKNAGYTNGLGDWVSLGTRTPARFIGVAYKAYTCRLMAEMCAAIGKTQDVAMYEAWRAEHIDYALNPPSNAGFNWADANMQTQTAYFWALLTGMYRDEEGRQDLIRRMENVVKNEGKAYHNGPEYTMTIGFAGINAALPSLSNEGRSDLAYDLLLQDTYPSWLNHIANGATTMWEQWSAYNAVDSYGSSGMNSFNHFAYGAVCEWLYTHVAGIETDRAGFKSIVLQPTIDPRTEPFGGSTQQRISSVKGRYNSYYGEIVSDWKSSGSKLTSYETVVPANTTATLYLPVDAGAVAGFKNISGVTFLGMEAHNSKPTAKFNLLAGGYSFKVVDGLLSVSLQDGYVDSGAVALSKAGTEAVANCSFANAGTAAVTVYSVLAIYNADGSLQSFLLDEKSVAPGAAMSVTLRNPLAAGQTARAFLWGAGYAPITVAKLLTGQ